MSDVVVRAENLGKRYRLGELVGYRTLRESLGSWAAAPARWLRTGVRRASGSDRADPHHVWALKDVSFEVRRGEVLGIIGRNGAGKSTLLKILTRITKPTTGRAAIRGRVGSLLEVGTGFHPELTGRENVFLNGAILGMRRAEIMRKFDEIVDFSGVQRFLDTPVKRYSSGMRVRLAFAVAAHLDPEILLIDEVLAVGDAEFQKKCLGKMGEVATEGRTVLFVSHNMAAVESLCSRCVVLDSGGLTLSAAPRDALEHYLARAVAKSSEVNLTGAVRAKGNSDRIFRSARLENSAGIATTQFRPGDAVVLRFVVAIPKEPRGVRIGIGVNNSLGERLFTVDSSLNAVTVPVAKGLQVLVCHLASVPLVPGRYAITLGLSTANGITELLRDVMSFSIEDADFFGVGIAPRRHAGHWLMKAEWQNVTAAERSVNSRSLTPDSPHR